MSGESLCPHCTGMNGVHMPECITQGGTLSMKQIAERAKKEAAAHVEDKAIDDLFDRSDWPPNRT